MPKKKEPQFTDVERTAEEIAWDEEFKVERPPNLASDLNSLAEFVVKLPGAMLSNVVPDETVRHTRAAVRESFLAVRTLLGAIGDGIEDMLAEPATAPDDAANAATVQGPPGTWGTGRSGQASSASGRAKRISVSE